MMIDVLACLWSHFLAFVYMCRYFLDSVEDSLSEKIVSNQLNIRPLDLKLTEYDLKQSWVSASIQC